MARSDTGTVIVLQSHPVWVVAQQNAAERREAMLRHPSSWPRKAATSRGIAVCAKTSATKPRGN